MVCQRQPGSAKATCHVLCFRHFGRLAGRRNMLRTGSAKATSRELLRRGRQNMRHTSNSRASRGCHSKAKASICTDVVVLRPMFTYEGRLSRSEEFKVCTDCCNHISKLTMRMHFHFVAMHSSCWWFPSAFSSLDVGSYWLLCTWWHSTLDFLAELERVPLAFVDEEVSDFYQRYRLIQKNKIAVDLAKGGPVAFATIKDKKYHPSLTLRRLWRPQSREPNGSKKG